MRRTVLAVGCSVLVSTGMAGQTRPAFEVASIRPATEQVAAVNVGVQIAGTQVRISAMSLKDYISIAYRVRPSQVSAPEWLGQARFDITARIPEGGSPEQVAEMLQSLLADRFGLVTRRESREFPVYALLVTNGGARLQESAPQPDAPTGPTAAVDVAASGGGGGVAVDLGGGSSFSLANNRLEARRISMPDLAELLGRFLDRAVVDQTDLDGRYDLVVPIPPEDYVTLLVRAAVNNGIVLPPVALAMLDRASPDPLSGPLQAVGLTLEARRAPLDVIVVDAVNREPTAN